MKKYANKHRKSMLNKTSILSSQHWVTDFIIRSGTVQVRIEVLYLSRGLKPQLRFKIMHRHVQTLKK